jgi:hypothetical protein
MRTDYSPATFSCSDCAPRAAAASEDHDFVFMLDAFRASGGMARADELACMLRHRHPDGLPVLARWIAAGPVVYFQWGCDYWLPLFQFQTGELAPRQAVRRVLAQLRPVFEPWDIAMWFARGNPWLEDETPACKVANHPLRVEQAARVDRFAING